MRTRVFCLVLGVAVVATGEVRQALEPLKPGEIVARGWLKDQLELSLAGASREPVELVPFGATCLRTTCFPTAR